MGGVSVCVCTSVFRKGVCVHVCVHVCVNIYIIKLCVCVCSVCPCMSNCV